MKRHEEEIREGERFAFGANWAKFLEVLTEERIRLAEESLCCMLEMSDLSGRRFLDVGSGSGLFSLAARRLGAVVHSFDYDAQSVACTQELKRRYFPDDMQWTVEQGSVLDREYLQSLRQWDMVYSWGVLHHTGAMWQALENVAPLVADKGRLFVAIYNDQGRASQVWHWVKRTYCAAPVPVRGILLGLSLVRLWGPTTLRDLLGGRPLHTWRNYARGASGAARGMSPWRDVVDWVGGYPFEVAKPEQVLRFYRDRGFTLTHLVTCAGGHGCNEYVFEKHSLGTGQGFK